MEAWLNENRIVFDRITNSEEAVLSQVGEAWYKMFFEGYTLKQWKRHPSQLSPSVCNRIPVRTSRDDRYFNDKHQCLPKLGYHALFNNMAKACGDRLEIRLETDYQEVLSDKSIQWDHMIFTGPIDSYFDYKFGPLPYRSLRFEHEHFSSEQLAASENSAKGSTDVSLHSSTKTDAPTAAHQRKSPKNEEKCFRFPLSSVSAFQFAQPCVQINYPSSEPFTRCVEAKHITGQQIEGTTIVREFPDDYSIGKEPFYPIPANDAQELYRKYAAEAEKLDHVSFIGRLGTYKYYNMDQVIGMALNFVKKRCRN
jgi:UDP-galactopyranose mutase